MSETTSETANAGDNSAEQQQAGQTFEAITSQEDLNRIVEARIARERKKYSDYDDLKSKAERLAEIEESQKSEQQRLQEQLEQFKSQAETAEREKQRLTVLAKHQIPEEYQDLVAGNDLDSLTASAEKVKTLIDANAPKGSASFVVPDEGGSPNLALNGDGIESALKKALGIS